MGQVEISAVLVPVFSVIALAVVGVLGRAILRRLPEGRVKSFFSWIPPWRRHRVK